MTNSETTAKEISKNPRLPAGLPPIHASERISPNVRPGAIWTPTHGAAHQKIITRITGTGTIHAARYPRRAGVLPSSFSPEAWKMWVRKTGAQWTGDLPNND